jgi:hypothetical protein
VIRAPLLELRAVASEPLASGVARHHKRASWRATRPRGRQVLQFARAFLRHLAAQLDLRRDYFEASFDLCRRVGHVCGACACARAR